MTTVLLMTAPFRFCKLSLGVRKRHFDVDCHHRRALLSYGGEVTGNDFSAPLLQHELPVVVYVDGKQGLYDEVFANLDNGW